MPESLKAINILAQSMENAPDDVLAFRSEHDKLWDSLGPQEAPLVRQALARAQEMRDKRADPGFAYLQGFVSSLAIARSVRPKPEQDSENEHTPAA